MKTPLSRIAALCLILSAAVMAQAQSYSINWYSIDGGGGVSKGGPYVLSGTIGQPDASISTGGSYSLQGGFWAGIVILGQEDMPTLYIDRAGQDVIVSWNPSVTGFVLESTIDLNDPVWTPISPDSPGSVTVPAVDTSRYYRLRK